MNRKLKLSTAGELRRQQMLGELQREVDLHQTSVRRRKLTNRLAAGVISAAAIGVFAWSTMTGRIDLENKSGNDTVIAVKNDPVDSQPKFRFASVESNRADVNERYLVANFQPRIEFESISDQELLSLLEATGNPAVLGEIDGQLTVIPSKVKRSVSRPRFGLN